MARRTSPRVTTSIFSTTGVCTGKVRSTPTPKLTLRTVKVSRTPPPWRRITTPWKTWMRERLPSTTRTCTLTVSPGRKAGMSSRSESASSASRVFISVVLVFWPLDGQADSGADSGKPGRPNQWLRLLVGAPVDRRRRTAAALYCATSSGDDARRSRPGVVGELPPQRRQLPWGEGLAAPCDLRRRPPPVRLVLVGLELRLPAHVDLVDDVAEDEVGLARVDGPVPPRAAGPAQPDRTLQPVGCHDEPDLLDQLAHGGLAQA